MNIEEAIDTLNSAGLSVISEESVKKIQLSDKFRTAWNALMYAMSDFTNWNRIVMWYVGNKYEKKAGMTGTVIRNPSMTGASERRPRNAVIRQEDP